MTRLMREREGSKDWRVGGPPRAVCPTSIAWGWITESQNSESTPEEPA